MQFGSTTELNAEAASAAVQGTLLAQVTQKKSKRVFFPLNLKSQKRNPITIEKNYKNALQNLQVA